MESEELPTRKHLTEEFCENHFKQNYGINEDGRYVVKLPVLHEHFELDNTKSLAISRLTAMERKFDGNSELGKEYKAFMTDYKELHHI